MLRPALLVCRLVLIRRLALIGCVAVSVGCDSPTPIERIESSYSKRLNEFHSVLESQPDEAAIARAKDTLDQLRQPLLVQALSILHTNPASPDATRAASWILRAIDADQPKHIEAAKYLLDQARRNTANRPPIAALGHLSGLHPIYEQLLTALAKDQVLLGPARYELAQLLESRAEFCTSMQATPELDPTRRINLGDEIVDYLIKCEPNKDSEKSRMLYLQVQRDSSNTLYNGKRLGDLVEDCLRPYTQDYNGIGQPAPTICAVDLDGHPQSLESLRGKVAMLTFWASWCGPCIVRIPAENKIAEQFADRDFVVIGINGDDSLDTARHAAKEHRVQFPVWWSPPETPSSPVQAFQVDQWPTTYLIDRQGNIRYRDLDDVRLIQAVNDLLSE